MRFTPFLRVEYVSSGALLHVNHLPELLHVPVDVGGVDSLEPRDAYVHGHS
jgi:hypothetical protein